jgi:hypothetical protein
LEYFRHLKPNGFKKGCYFDEQVTGEETIYHLLEFVNAQQRLANELGDKEYIKELKRVNLNSPCLKK